ncbi:MAG: 16S rRNA (uracil(1498)-N(3))-methyltransferase [Coriobacteriia bacterium]|nr:16S rRNA (uracil(1498)-N(3))-methyltransferase [Coriobacteriia bacterium]
MSLHRFFLTAPLAAGAPAAPGEAVALALDGGDAWHLQRVLRLGAGDRFVAVEPGGREVVVRLAEVGAGLSAVPEEELPRRHEPRVTLVQGVGKGPKTDLVVEKATEIGAEEVLPVLTARTVVRLDARKRAERGQRWRRVAAEAAKQSQRAFVPRVEDAVELGGVLEALRGFDAVLVPWEEAEGRGVRGALAATASDARVAVVVGPEGGLTAEEVARLAAVGGVPVTLGRNVLRTETAGIVALALAIHELGGLGGRDG